jgi:hypothetical protein
MSERTYDLRGRVTGCLWRFVHEWAGGCVCLVGRPVHVYMHGCVAARQRRKGKRGGSTAPRTWFHPRPATCCLAAARTSVTLLCVLVRAVCCVRVLPIVCLQEGQEGGQGQEKKEGRQQAAQGAAQEAQEQALSLPGL